MLPWPASVMDGPCYLPWPEAGCHGRGREPRKKMERKEKKIIGVFWSFHISIHVGTSALACHVIEKDNVSAKRASLNTFPNKNDKFVGVIPKMAF